MQSLLALRAPLSCPALSWPPEVTGGNTCVSLLSSVVALSSLLRTSGHHSLATKALTEGDPSSSRGLALTGFRGVEFIIIIAVSGSGKTAGVTE